MKNRAFLIVFTAIIAVCALVTAAHIIYAYNAYENCSIIYFVGKELW